MAAMAAPRYRLARRLARDSHMSATRPLVSAIQKLSPCTPLRSAICASTGVCVTPSPSGSQGNARSDRWFIATSDATQTMGSSTAIGHRVLRRAANSAPPVAAARTVITNNAPR